LTLEIGPASKITRGHSSICFTTQARTEAQGARC
jgi:hypothetical protein